MKITKVQQLKDAKSSTIPKDVAEKLKLEKGDYVNWKTEGDKVIVTKVKGE